VAVAQWWQLQFGACGSGAVAVAVAYGSVAVAVAQWVSGELRMG
jgi:hypothetical protein